MQYQKEEVRNRILQSALNEFDKNGYSGTQMRRIAQEAGVATGNIYRYFHNKEEVFEAIVQPVYAHISSIIFDLYKPGDERSDIREITNNIAKKIMEVYRRHGRALMVITDKSKGSKYEDFSETLVTLVCKRLKGELSFKGIDDTNDVLAYVISSGFVRGIFSIMRYSNDSHRIEELVNRMLVFYFENLEQRLQ
jgi:AcrR family transcriptional regulator